MVISQVQLLVDRQANLGPSCFVDPDDRQSSTLSHVDYASQVVIYFLDTLLEVEALVPKVRSGISFNHTNSPTSPKPVDLRDLHQTPQCFDATDPRAELLLC